MNSVYRKIRKHVMGALDTLPKAVEEAKDIANTDAEAGKVVQDQVTSLRTQLVRLKQELDRNIGE